jgi:hypothetical protein
MRGYATGEACNMMVYQHEVPSDDKPPNRTLPLLQKPHCAISNKACSKGNQECTVECVHGYHGNYQ